MGAFSGTGLAFKEKSQGYQWNWGHFYKGVNYSLINVDGFTILVFNIIIESNRWTIWIVCFLLNSIHVIFWSVSMLNFPQFYHGFWVETSHRPHRLQIGMTLLWPNHFYVSWSISCSYILSLCNTPVVSLNHSLLDRVMDELPWKTEGPMLLISFFETILRERVVLQVCVNDYILYLWNVVYLWLYYVYPHSYPGARSSGLCQSDWSYPSLLGVHVWLCCMICFIYCSIFISRHLFLIPQFKG